MSPRRTWLLTLLALGAWLGLPSLARAQQEAKFIGWAADGSGVIQDVNLERNLKCKPAPYKFERAAPENGCTPCAGKKACAVAGSVEEAGASADGKSRAERDKEKRGVLLVSVEGEPAPRKLALHIGKEAKVQTWFRPDGKALALLVHDDEDRFYVVDLAAPAKK